MRGWCLQPFQGDDYSHISRSYNFCKAAKKISFGYHDIIGLKCRQDIGKQRSLLGMAIFTGENINWHTQKQIENNQRLSQQCSGWNGAKFFDAIFYCLSWNWLRPVNKSGYWGCRDPPESVVSAENWTVGRFRAVAVMAGLMLVVFFVAIVVTWRAGFPSDAAALLRSNIR